VNKAKLVCPKCLGPSIEVGFDTVFNLTDNFIRHKIDIDKYYLCINSECEVAYFTINEFIIPITQLNKPLWFKNTNNQIIVCYCRDISLGDVIYAVNELKDDITIKSIVRLLQKDDRPLQCIQHNPTGMSCEKLFVNAIEYGKKIKNMK
jgi:hypothetical protein